jgi:hypothetical protein
MIYIICIGVQEKEAVCDFSDGNFNKFSALVSLDEKSSELAPNLAYYADFDSIIIFD